MEAHKVAVIVGSLREASWNRKVAEAVRKLAPSTLDLQFVEIGDLPLYNEDVEKADVPAAWTAFRSAMSEVDAVLFFTPEYNRSIPGCLKNAIDVGSRPYGKSIWSKKPAGVISAANGALGGFGANHALRQAMVFLDVPVMQQPEAYIGNVSKLFDESGALINVETKAFLTNFLTAFEDWVKRLARRNS
jgi:chromate reductase